MRRRQSTAGSLDSLLDTMTNVVGILVILLAVTQLGVRDAVQRISTSTTVDPHEYQALRSKLVELFRTHEELCKRRDALKPEENQDVALQIRLVQKQIEDARHDIDVLRQAREEKRQKKQQELAALVAEAKRRLAEQKKKEDELKNKILAAEDELARLRAQLAEPVAGETPAPKTIYLPNPRPAPEGKRPFVILCRGGRVFPVDKEAIQQRAQLRVQYLIRRKALDRDPAAGIDGKQLVEAFRQDNMVRDRNFDILLTVQGRIPKLVLKRKADGGETLQRIKRSGSFYRRTLALIDPQHYYLRFLVWPDSFAVYLEARQLATRRGLDAGWQPMTGQGEYTIELGGNLRLGPPPKPKPKPPPSTKPAPQPKPQPPPRPKPPADEID